MIKRLIWTIWTPMSSVLKKADKLNLSLSHWLGPFIKWSLHNALTHWGRATHICVNNLTIIASDNGLSPGRRQAIIWTSAGILLIGPLGTNFSEILVEIKTFSFKKMRLKVSSVKWRPCCLGLNVGLNVAPHAFNTQRWPETLQIIHHLQPVTWGSVSI